jgi:hypothetical protein
MNKPEKLTTLGKKKKKKKKNKKKKNKTKTKHNLC